MTLTGLMPYTGVSLNVYDVASVYIEGKVLIEYPYKNALCITMFTMFYNIWNGNLFPKTKMTKHPNLGGTLPTFITVVPLSHGVCARRCCILLWHLWTLSCHKMLALWYWTSTSLSRVWWCHLQEHSRGRRQNETLPKLGKQHPRSYNGSESELSTLLA